MYPGVLLACYIAVKSAGPLVVCGLFHHADDDQLLADVRLPALKPEPIGDEREHASRVAEATYR